MKCKICKKEFKVYPYQIKKGKSMCSRKCAAFYKSINWDKIYGKIFPKKDLNRKCIYCNKLFIPSDYRVNFCSRNCVVRGRNGINRRNRKVIKCQKCGDKFEIKNNRLNIAKYCSVKCYGKFGINNPFYNRKHPIQIRKKISATKQGILVNEWKKFVSSERKLAMGTPRYKNWRMAVFKRDDFTCVWCGQIGGELNADHIKSWALYPKLRYRLTNGRTLCLDCHKSTSTYLKFLGGYTYAEQN